MMDGQKNIKSERYV